MAVIEARWNRSGRPRRSAGSHRPETVGRPAWPGWIGTSGTLRSRGV